MSCAVIAGPRCEWKPSACRGLTLYGEDLVPVLLGVHEEGLIAVDGAYGDLPHLCDEVGAEEGIEDPGDATGLLWVTMEGDVEEHVDRVDIADSGVRAGGEARLGLGALYGQAVHGQNGSNSGATLQMPADCTTRAWLRSSSFCCCIPVRAGFVLITILTFLLSGAISIIIWFEISRASSSHPRRSSPECHRFL